VTDTKSNALIVSLSSNGANVGDVTDQKNQSRKDANQCTRLVHPVSLTVVVVFMVTVCLFRLSIVVRFMVGVSTFCCISVVITVRLVGMTLGTMMIGSVHISL
tara:strand:- start:559 stop:867 length:309 start_codon:yes stop_codon:yes gene_type:complete